MASRPIPPCSISAEHTPKTTSCYFLTCTRYLLTSLIESRHCITNAVHFQWRTPCGYRVMGGSSKSGHPIATLKPRFMAVHADIILSGLYIPVISISRLAQLSFISHRCVATLSLKSSSASCSEHVTLGVRDVRYPTFEHKKRSTSSTDIWADPTTLDKRCCC